MPSFELDHRNPAETVALVVDALPPITDNNRLDHTQDQITAVNSNVIYAQYHRRAMPYNDMHGNSRITSNNNPMVPLYLIGADIGIYNTTGGFLLAMPRTGADRKESGNRLSDRLYGRDNGDHPLAGAQFAELRIPHDEKLVRHPIATAKLRSLIHQSIERPSAGLWRNRDYPKFPMDLFRRLDELTPRLASSYRVGRYTAKLATDFKLDS